MTEIDQHVTTKVKYKMCDNETNGVRELMASHLTRGLGHSVVICKNAHIAYTTHPIMYPMNDPVRYHG